MGAAEALKIDAVDVARAMIRCPSVTPIDAGAQDVLAAALTALGFEIHRLRFGEAPDGPVDNLFATLGGPGQHIAFAGHTDVVPAGELSAWSSEPFAGTVHNGWLIGRGANDMKGSIGAFVEAAGRAIARGFDGRISLIITGDEEGPALYGTDKLLDWMSERGFRPDACIVGEPTSSQVLGDTIKIGRRGSLNCWIAANGAQGHVAYPARADNPIPRLVAALAAVQARAFDDASEWFDASNLEITDIYVGNPAANVIPARATARLNIRFNDRHRGADLEAWLRETIARHAPGAEVTIRISGEAFLTEPGTLSRIVAAAVKEVTGRTPVLSTTGGTSDARFIRRMCPVVEFGLVGATMHKVDEAVPVEDIRALTDIYDAALRRFFAGEG